MSDVSDKLLTLPPFVRDYLYSIQNTTTVRTQLAYLTDIEAFLEYLSMEKNVPVLSITPELLSECSRVFYDGYFHYLRQYEKNGVERTNDAASIRRKRSALQSLTSYLYDCDLLPENVMEKVRTPKLRPKVISRLDNDEVSSLFSAVEHGTGSKHQAQYQLNTRIRDLAILATLLSTGIRVSELTKLDLTDVDLEKSSLRVVRKGKKEAIVYFSDEAAEYLADYYDLRKERIQPLPGHETALFLSLQRKRMTPRTVETLIKKYGKSAVPLKKIFPHLMRKTYGSRMYDAMGDIYLVAKLLGHESVETTAKHYIASEKELSGARNVLSLCKNKKGKS